MNIIARKGGGGAPKPAKEADDSLHNNSIAEMVDLLCEGEIEEITQEN